MSADLRDRRTQVECRHCGSTDVRPNNRGFCSDACRLLAKVTELPNGCWQWNAAKAPDGYGHLAFDGRVMGAHRVSYMLFVGAIPDGLVIDHLCRNRACVNPSHLEPVTPHENVIVRGFAPASLVYRTNRCKRGHEFTPANTYRRPDTGYRMCRACCAIRETRRAS